MKLIYHTGKKIKVEWNLEGKKSKNTIHQTLTCSCQSIYCYIQFFFVQNKNNKVKKKN